MMWLGGSWRIWMMYSPRSVSTGVMPFGFEMLVDGDLLARPSILPLVTVLAPSARQIASTARARFGGGRGTNARRRLAP